MPNAVLHSIAESVTDIDSGERKKALDSVDEQFRTQAEMELDRLINTGITRVADAVRYGEFEKATELVIRLRREVTTYHPSTANTKSC
jgi:glycyl-tRNA synthetase beta subunit